MTLASCTQICIQPERVTHSNHRAIVIDPNYFTRLNDAPRDGCVPGLHQWRLVSGSLCSRRQLKTIRRARSRIVVPYPLGGGHDARIISDPIKTMLGQPVIENVSGAGGSIGVG